jgi:hypothetical protein
MRNDDDGREENHLPDLKSSNRDRHHNRLEIHDSAFIIPHSAFVSVHVDPKAVSALEE